MPKEKDDLKFSKLPPAFNPPFTGLLKLERRKAISSHLSQLRL
jgi:hypothetical protein